MNDSREVRSSKKGTGHVDLATDLMRLARLYEEHEPALAGDTRHYEPADREEAKRVSHAIMHELGEARQGEAAIWSDQVSRTWTLLADTYDEVSAAGRFLFRHDGAASYFPSLITVSRDRPSRARGDGQPDDEVPAGLPEDDASGDALLAGN